MSEEKSLTPLFAHRHLNNAAHQLGEAIGNNNWQGTPLIRRMDMIKQDIEILMREIMNREHDISEDDL